MADMDLDPERVLIEPRRGKYEEPVDRFVIMMFTPQDLKIASRVLGFDPSKGRKLDLSMVYPIQAGGKRGISVAGPAMGAPAAAFLMERLIALGARIILSVGSCGSIQKEIPIGHAILPEGAVSEEGTSLHYLTGKNRCIPAPDKGLIAQLETRLRASGIPFHKGKVWTTDAPFRETVGKVTKYQREGILGVEMETSALLAVGAFRGVSFASILVVSDELASLKWKKGFKDPRFRSTFEKACRICAESCSEF